MTTWLFSLIAALLLEEGAVQQIPLEERRIWLDVAERRARELASMYDVNFKIDEGGVFLMPVAGQLQDLAASLDDEGVVYEVVP